jgi:L-aminopeptidase/D-esterase-like protein
VRPPLWGRLTDVPGVRVGHARRAGHGRLSGVTVILPPPGTIGSVDVRGGGPGTHETDALDPSTLVPNVDAVTLTGGSAFGLAAARGVQEWCERDGRGFAAGPPDDPRSLLVPIVPAAAVFDLGRGGEPNAPGARPDAEIGYEAAKDAGDGEGRPEPRGNEGAGTGALMASGSLKGGVGTASVRLPGGVTVGALVVVNARGSPVDPETGALLGRAFVPAGRPRPPVPDPAEHRRAVGRDPGAPTSHGRAGLNTTLAVVVTDARLTPA